MRRRLVIVLLAAAPATSLGAQERAGAPLELRAGEAGTRSVTVHRHRGYAAVAMQDLAAVGWRSEPVEDGWLLTLESHGVSVVAEPGSPFVFWNGTLVQLTDRAYVVDDELHLPLHFVTDVLPDRLPSAFRAPAPRVLERVAAPGGGVGPVSRRSRSTPPRSAGPAPAFVVVIDPGHGGDDPGAMGPGGTREKDLALALGLALADSLRARHGFEVHLTRERDELVPLWLRGEMATRLKGERPGVFISIHANALASRTVRGVETYFLSEARTEHERRVAALENAPLALERPGFEHEDPGLGFILSELRNHDHQHWSADLASGVQRSLAAVHPGPNRGVKQGPFAVITNALMPAVLVEVGFITHRDEERALSDAAFQARAAGAVAAAVEAFARRYPPGRSSTLEGAR
jgi:N-acetylmuramoyl-L-alanine amidase